MRQRSFAGEVPPLVEICWQIRLCHVLLLSVSYSRNTAATTTAAQGAGKERCLK
jgi:hypothetical protein